MEENKKSEPKRKRVDSISPDFVYNTDKNKDDRDAKKSNHEDSLAKELSYINNNESDSSMEFEDLTKKPKKKKKLKAFVITFLIILILSGIGIFAYFASKAGKVSTNPFNFSTKLKGEDQGRVNILLLGVGDPGHDGETLADTNMVVSIDTNNNKAAMTSIPRDTRVTIPNEGYGKINTAHALGEQKDPPQGIELAQKTVEETLGIPIHYYVRANFAGLKQAVDAVGGINIDVKEPLSDPEYPCDNNQYRSCGFKLAAGPTTMDGNIALKYARCRKGTCGDDFGRALRQQEVLTAIRAKATSSETLSNPKKLNSLIDAAANNIKTNMSLSEIQRAYEIGKKINTDNILDIVFSTKPNGLLKQDPSSSDLLPSAGDFDEIQELVKNVFTVGGLWSENAGVIIENGTTTPGLAAKLEAKLNNNGALVNILTIQNSDKNDYTTTQIIDYSKGKKSQTIKYFEDLLGVKATQATESQKPNGSEDIVIILGSDFAEKITQNGISQ